MGLENYKLKAFVQDEWLKKYANEGHMSKDEEAFKGVCTGLAVRWLRHQCRHDKAQFDQAHHTGKKTLESKFGRSVKVQRQHQIDKKQMASIPEESATANTVRSATTTLLKNGLKCWGSSHESTNKSIADRNFDILGKQIEAIPREEFYFLMSLHWYDPHGTDIGSHMWAGAVRDNGIRIFDPIRGVFYAKRAEATTLLNELRKDYLEKDSRKIDRAVCILAEEDKENPIERSPRNV
jgi:hypothetical protein